MDIMHNPVEAVRNSAALLAEMDALQKRQPLRGLRPGGRSQHAASPVGEHAGVSTSLSPLAVSLSKVGLTHGQLRALADSSSQVQKGRQVAGAGDNQATAPSVHSLELESHYRKLQAEDSEARPLRRANIAHLSMGASQVRRNTASPFLREVDIKLMVRLLMNDVRSTVAGHKPGHAGVVLGHAELEDLLAEDGNRSASNVMDLIDLTIMLARLKQLLDDERSGGAQDAGENGNGGTESLARDPGEPAPADRP